MRILDTELYEVSEGDFKTFRKFARKVAVTVAALFFVVALQMIFFMAESTSFMADKGYQALSIVFACVATKLVFEFCFGKLEAYFREKLESAV